MSPLATTTSLIKITSPTQDQAPLSASMNRKAVCSQFVWDWDLKNLSLSHIDSHPSMIKAN